MTAAKVLAADHAAVCDSCGSETTDLRDTDDGQLCPECAEVAESDDHWTPMSYSRLHAWRL